MAGKKSRVAIQHIAPVAFQKIVLVGLVHRGDAVPGQFGLCVVDRVILRLDVGGPVEVYLGLVIYVADPVKVADSMIVCLGTAVPRTFPPTWAPFIVTRTTRKFGGRKVLCGDGLAGVA
jgi:hypothetical protein